MSGCKVYLVPEDVIHQWQAEQRQNAVDKPKQNQEQKMDDTMNTILSEKDISEYDKEKLYSQELGKYLNTRQVPSMVPSTVPSTVPSSSSGPSTDPPLASSVLNSMPKMYQNKAKALLDYLQEDKSIQWDERGQLSVQGQKIPESHILDLVHDAMRLRKKVSRPQGWRELSRHLKQTNVPKELLGNPRWFTPPTSPERGIKAPSKQSLAQKKTFRVLSTVARPPRQNTPRKSKFSARRKITDWVSI